MSNVAISSQAASQMLEKLREMQRESQASIKMDTANTQQSSGRSFFDQLKEGVAEVNNMQKTADKVATDLATGKSGNLHETMLAISSAELAFNLMVQVRNRALEAYQEVMRMQV